MGEAFLDYKKGGNSLDINGIIQDYYVYAGENINAGDFVEFINGIASQTMKTSVDTAVVETKDYGCSISACKLTNNKVFIAHGTSTTASSSYLYGVVCEIDGATITYGTDTQLHSTANSAYKLDAVALEEDKVFIAYSYGTNYATRGIVCTISGTTITPNSSYTTLSSAYTGYSISAKLLSNGKVFVTNTTSSSGRHLYGMICTVDGTTITAGTHTKIVGESYAGQVASTAVLSNSKVFIAHSKDSSYYYLYGIVCTVDGTTITAGTDTQLVNTASSASGMAKSSLVAFDDGRVFIPYSGKNTAGKLNLYGMVVTISGTTITAGTGVLIGNSNFYSDYASAGQSVKLDNTRIFIAHNAVDTSKLYGVIITISGTAIVAGIDTLLYDVTYANQIFPTVLLGSGDIFIAHSMSSSWHLYAQVWGVDETNNIPTNQIAIAEYETQVKPATTLPCDGVAKSSGVGGSSAAHNQQVSVYTSLNGIPTEWEEVTAGTEYVASDGAKLTASSMYQSYSPTNVCDRDDTTWWQPAAGYTHWLQLEFPFARKITKLRSKISQVQPITQFEIQGSNNGSSWDTLYTSTSAQGSFTTTTLTKTGMYKFYRIYYTMPTSGYVRVYGLEILG